MQTLPETATEANPETLDATPYAREDIGLEATIPATGRPRQLKHRQYPRRDRGSRTRTRKAPLWPESDPEPGGDETTVAAAMPDRPSETTIEDPRDETEYEDAVAMTRRLWAARQSG